MLLIGSYPGIGSWVHSHGRNGAAVLESGLENHMYDFEWGNNDKQEEMREVAESYLDELTPDQLTDSINYLCTAIPFLFNDRQSKPFYEANLNYLDEEHREDTWLQLHITAIDPNSIQMEYWL